MILPRFFLTLSLVGFMAGCTEQAKDNTSQTLDAVGNETTASYSKVRNYFDVGHKPPPPKGQLAQPRYCYKTYQDVICYANPIPGEEYRLVGFQTSNGKVGYVINPEPVPGGDGDDLPPLKKVTVTSPPAIKAVGSNDSQLKEIIFDPGELEPKELVPEKPQ